MTDPILIDFPDEILSERLIIRRYHPGDGQSLYEAVAESRDHLRPWMPWADHHQQPISAEKWVRGAIVRWLKREDLTMSIWRKSDGLYIGGSGLHRIDWDVPRFEIGYWVRASCEGQGYITETAIAVRDFAFETLKAERVEIRCDATNERSAAVALRAGFRLEAALRHDMRNMQGQLRDTLIHALLREEWATLIEQLTL